MSKILLNKGRFGVVKSRYEWAWAGLWFRVDYHSAFLTVNVFTHELTVEFVHAGLHKTNWNSYNWGFEIPRNEN